MLVNLTPIPEEIERRRGLAEHHGFNYTPQSDPKYIKETGVYENSCPFNFGKNEFLETKNLRHDQEFPRLRNKSEYGVADTLAQIKEYFREEISDPVKKYFIAISGVWQNKKNAGEGGGWRWHKWGPYIGDLNPQCEYLDDEDFGDDFEYVICFHIMDVTGNVEEK